MGSRAYVFERGSLCHSCGSACAHAAPLFYASLAHIPLALWLALRGLARVPQRLLSIYTSIWCTACSEAPAIAWRSVRCATNGLLGLTSSTQSLFCEQHWKLNPPHDDITQELYTCPSTLLQTSALAKASASSRPVCNVSLSRWSRYLGTAARHCLEVRGASMLQDRFNT
mmetsp:Transcript_49311/g.77997  ORF Transcript_49311/g.77997 Transcript_49311/m.77997 type:complete len:170 (-) Transcript_49311:5-514(-)